MREIQSVIVLDCTGPLGLQILHKAIHHELDVTAYALEPAKIPENISRRLRQTIQGDILDQEKVEGAVAGHDAVFCAIESYNMFSRNEAITQGCRNIVEAMKKHGIKKLAIVNDAIALHGSAGIRERIRKKYGINAEYIQMMDVLEKEKASIDWVAIMLPTVVISQKVNPTYKVERGNMPGEWSVTSGETADFIVKVFLDKTSAECFRHNALGISSRPKRKRRFLSLNIVIGIAVAGLAVLMYFRVLPPVLQQYIDELTEFQLSEID